MRKVGTIQVPLARQASIPSSSMKEACSMDRQPEGDGRRRERAETCEGSVLDPISSMSVSHHRDLATSSLLDTGSQLLIGEVSVLWAVLGSGRG
jgi:hypothetical protein